MHRELVLGLSGVLGVDGGAPVHYAGVHQALAVEEGQQQHLLCAAGVDLGLDGPGRPFFDPLLKLLSGM